MGGLQELEVDPEDAGEPGTGASKQVWPEAMCV